MPNPTFPLDQTSQDPLLAAAVPPSPFGAQSAIDELPKREIEREWQDPAGNPPPYYHLTMHDLPSEDPEESGLPDEFHDFQPALLRETCQLQRPDFFVGVDLNLYYDPYHPLWHKRPDWFLALGVSPARTQAELRLSYVLWQEQTSPFLVVELLSPGTEDDDLGNVVQKIGKPTVKWDVYEQVLKVPFYVIYDRYENQLRVFELREGRYQPLDLATPKFWFESLGMGLGLWQGVYQGAEGEWLRWFDRAASPLENRVASPLENRVDRWIPTPAEYADLMEQRAEQASQRAEQESQRAEQESQRAEQESQRAEQESQRAEQESQRAEQESQRAEQESQRAEQESQRAEQESQRAEQLAERLRSLGIDPDRL
jgi:Uma2 family endonuclease